MSETGRNLPAEGDDRSDEGGKGGAGGAIEVVSLGAAGEG